MASNVHKILEKYSLCKEDGRATASRTSSLEFYYTKKHLADQMKQTDTVLELGCATGHYGMYYADKCKSYLGIDIVPEHIQLFQQKITEKQHGNLACQVGDATCLTGIDDNSFDVVLCLGPLYHLPANERELVFAECARVCKKGGVLAFAYINKIGVYAGACVMDSRYPNSKATQCVLENGTDDERPDTFFYSTPEQMHADAEKQGLCKIKNLATDFFVTMPIVDAMDDTQFETMRPLYDQMTSHESCTGMSSHALLVCKK